MGVVLYYSHPMLERGRSTAPISNLSQVGSVNQIESKKHVVQLSVQVARAPSSWYSGIISPSESATDHRSCQAPPSVAGARLISTTSQLANSIPIKWQYTVWCADTMMRSSGLIG